MTPLRLQQLLLSILQLQLQYYNYFCYAVSTMGGIASVSTQDVFRRSIECRSTAIWQCSESNTQSLWFTRVKRKKVDLKRKNMLRSAFRSAQDGRLKNVAEALSVLARRYYYYWNTTNPASILPLLLLPPVGYKPTTHLQNLFFNNRETQIMQFFHLMIPHFRKWKNETCWRWRISTQHQPHAKLSKPIRW